MLTRIVVALILAPFFVAALTVLPELALVIMVAGILAIAAFELLRAVGVTKEQWCLYFFTAASAAVVPFLVWNGWNTIGVKALAVALACALFTYAIFRYERKGAVDSGTILFCLMGGILIPVFFSSLIQLRMEENGSFKVLLPVVVAILTDTGAYFVGMFLGKHRGITLVSPKKSAEGFVGGLLSGVVFMLCYGVVLQQCFHVQVSMPVMALYGFVGSLVTILGDLSFSLIKRQVGIKDYGHLLPGHGGMLDRFDSTIFAAPAMWVLINVLPAF
ncbi:MAG: phosphatidate cytidylyltransferase [Oscillospiraceae bacterium]|nr:phosphatidate cytidylyltransferase [Oscillospiraceae bacterium]